MSVYRIKQFIWAVTSKFKPIDNDTVKKYLNEDEEKLFNKLSSSEKQHSIRVCKQALSSEKSNNENVNSDKLAKIALLHDIGKSETRLNAIDKSIIVILDKVTRGKIKRYTNKNKKIDIYYNHAKKSVKLLKGINKYDREFLQAVGQHHKKDNKHCNIYLEIIKESDDKC